MQFTVRRRATQCGAALMLAGALTIPAHAEVSLSGNVGVVSDYVLWGITTPVTESDGPALQGGFDLTHSSGFYAGWWASSLGYAGDNMATAVENGLYLGFSGGDKLTYDVGVWRYQYMDLSDFNAWEPYVSIGYGLFSISANFLTDDTAWGNSGDTYYTAGLDFEFGGSESGNSFNLGLLARWFSYEDSGEFIDSTEESSGFRHFDVTLSRQIGDTPATMFATYTIGGKDRQGLDQENKIILGFNFEFDIL